MKHYEKKFGVFHYENNMVSVVLLDTYEDFVEFGQPTHKDGSYPVAVFNTEQEASALSDAMNFSVA